MHTAIEEFRLNIARTRQLGAIYKMLSTDLMPHVDNSDLLRSELVMALSAFDFFVHEITRMGMIEIYQGKRPQTPAFLRFTVSFDQILLGMAAPQEVKWLNNAIKQQHSWQSFQQPTKVADAIRYISDVPLWDEVAKYLAITTKDIKQQLTLIVERRNKIVHEADMTPVQEKNEHWDIDAALVDNAVDFLEQVAETIARVV
jgi:hypothetical protein